MTDFIETIIAKLIEHYGQQTAIGSIKWVFNAVQQWLPTAIIFPALAVWAIAVIWRKVTGKGSSR